MSAKTLDTQLSQAGHLIECALATLTPGEHRPTSALQAALDILGDIRTVREEQTPGEAAQAGLHQACDALQDAILTPQELKEVFRMLSALMCFLAARCVQFNITFGRT